MRRWLLLVLAGVMLAGCGAPTAPVALAPTQTPYVIVVTATPVPPTDTPVAPTATPEPPTDTPAPIETPRPTAVPPTADERYLLDAIKPQTGSLAAMQSWLDGYKQGKVGSADLVQDGQRQYNALIGQYNRVVVAWQPVRSEPYRCLARVALIDDMDQARVAMALAQLGGLALGGQWSPGTVTAAENRATQVATWAFPVDSWVRNSVNRVDNGFDLGVPNAPTLAVLLANNPQGPDALANYGCAPSELATT